jgi:hypothetical protein
MLRVPAGFSLAEFIQVICRWKLPLDPRGFDAAADWYEKSARGEFVLSMIFSCNVATVPRSLAVVSTPHSTMLHGSNQYQHLRGETITDPYWLYMQAYWLPCFSGSVPLHPVQWYSAGMLGGVLGDAFRRKGIADWRDRWCRVGAADDLFGSLRVVLAECIGLCQIVEVSSGVSWWDFRGLDVFLRVSSGVDLPVEAFYYSFSTSGPPLTRPEYRADEWWRCDDRRSYGSQSILGDALLGVVSCMMAGCGMEPVAISVGTDVNLPCLGRVSRESMESSHVGLSSGYDTMTPCLPGVREPMNDIGLTAPPPGGVLGELTSDIASGARAVSGPVQSASVLSSLEDFITDFLVADSPVGAADGPPQKKRVVDIPSIPSGVASSSNADICFRESPSETISSGFPEGLNYIADCSVVGRNVLHPKLRGHWCGQYCLICMASGSYVTQCSLHRVEYH